MQIIRYSFDLLIFVLSFSLICERNFFKSSIAKAERGTYHHVTLKCEP